MSLTMPSGRAFTGLLLLPLLAASAHAGGARILRPSGGAEFSQISTAVYAALPGDVIVVGEGDYDGFTLEGKAVSIVGAPGASVRIVHPVVVRDIPAGQVVLFDNLHFAPDIAYPSSPLKSSDVPALWVSDCDASLRIQDCRLDTSYQNPFCVGAVSPDPTRRDSPLRLERCPDVAVVASDLITGAAGSGWGYCHGSDGAPGVQATDSNLALYGCAITGGSAGSGVLDPFLGHGGPGIDATNAFVFLAGSSSAGGWSNPGLAGSAVRLDQASTLVLEDSALVPWGSAPAIDGPGSVLELPDAARSLAAPAVAAGGARIQVEVVGAAGDLVWTAVAAGGGFRFASQVAGVWLTKSPAKVPVAPSGVAGPSGTLAFALPVVEPVGLARIADLQSITKSAADGTVVTNPRVVLVLSPTLGPDCNGNGVSDYVDVLLGGVPDDDHDLVPDGCPAPPKTVHVDAAAAPGGDGSALAPFVNMAQASGAALDGDTILVADGTYVGPANRAFDFDGRRLTIASVNGPDACVFDFEGKDSGFLVRDTGGASAGASRIEGLTLLRPIPSPLALPLPSGSIVVSDVELEVVGCRFGIGDRPILTQPGSALLSVRDTEFVGCARGVELWAPATIEDCRFAGLQRICILKYGATHSLRVSRTSFVGSAGGLHALTTPSGPLTVENCLFLGNWAQYGTGGIELDGGNAWIDACTFVGNHSQFKSGSISTLALGGALYLHAPTSGSVLLSNSILRDNTCGSTIGVGQQIAIEGGITYKLTIVRSSIQDGKPGIAGPSGATIWGAGNQTSDPLFVDPDGPDNDPQTLDDNDLHLSPASPCIDAGDNALALGLVDLEGLPRFVDDPNVPDTGSGSPPLCDMGCFEKP